MFREREIFRQEPGRIVAFRCWREEEEPEKNQAVVNCCRYVYKRYTNGEKTFERLASLEEELNFKVGSLPPKMHISMVINNATLTMVTTGAIALLILILFLIVSKYRRNRFCYLLYLFVLKMLTQKFSILDKITDHPCSRALSSFGVKQN